MKKLLLIFCSVIAVNSYAMVEIDTAMDFYGQGKKLAALAAVLAGAERIMSQVEQTTNVVDQIQALKSLQQLRSDAGTLCPTCTGGDVSKIQAYVDNINNDLFTQISNIQQKTRAVGDIVGVIQGLVGVSGGSAFGPAASGAIIQAASTATLSNIQNTLVDIQAMQAQQLQLQLAEKAKLKADAQGTITSDY